MSLKALIPVRAGSDRVKNKNIRPFAGSNLLEIKIKQLQRIDGIEEICVNSDCDRMLELAKKLGATPIKRDPYFASSTVPMNEVWTNLAKNMDCTDILYTNVTNPLVADSTYEKFINQWKLKKTNNDSSFDSITSVHEVVEYLWEKSAAINYDPNYHPRSQDLPRYYGLNFAINIIPKNIMISRSNIVARKFLPIFMSKFESIDIDELEDFALAELIYKARKND